MKRLFQIFISCLLLFISAASVFAQQKAKINGRVINTANKGVEFGTLYNLNQKTACITNQHGNFTIVAEIGDKLRIQHVNYKTKDVTVGDAEIVFIIEEKQIQLDEVVVSPKQAFDLFNTACTNTWNLFKQNNISRAYCRVVRKTNDYIAQTADLDLDIVQKKYKNFSGGELVKTYKAQEKIDKPGTEKYGLPGMELTFFYPQIQEIYWVELPNKFNYYKIDEEEFIRMRLMNKKEYPYHVRIEILISRKDSTLHLFAMNKRDLTTFSIGSAGIEKRSSVEYDDYLLEKTNHYILYGFEDGFSYLKEYYQDVCVAENKIRNNKIKLSQHLLTYDNGLNDIERRRGRRRIFKNSYNPLKTINRYETDFWNSCDLMNLDYDFEQLSEIGGSAGDKVLVASVDSFKTPDNAILLEKGPNISRYELEKKKETILEISQKYNLTTDDILFVPYYTKNGRPVYSDKKYGIQDMLINIESPEILNNIMQVFYSNKPLLKTKFGCVNFTCIKDFKNHEPPFLNDSEECLVFPFSCISEDVKVDGFAIYLIK